VAALSGYQYSPVAAPDGAGGAFLAWLDDRLPPTQVYAQRLDASGVPQWTVDGIPIRLAPGVSHRTPAIVADGEGGAIVACASVSSSVFKVCVQRLDAAGSRLWGPSGVIVCPAAAGRQEEPRLVPDGSGGAIIVWRDWRTDDKGDLYAQRVSAAGALQWDSAGVPICVSAKEQMRQAVIAGGDGSAIVAWEDYRLGFGRIYAQLVGPSGVVQWAPDGVAASPALSPGSSTPAIVEDGASGAVIVWQDFRWLPNRAIYAQRLNHTGASHWDSSGVALGVPAANANEPCAVSDGAGGAIVAWSGPIGIHAQRVSASGALLFDPLGMRLTNAPGYETLARIASDGVGGAVVAWRDSRSGGANADIYAQRVNAEGVLKWEPEGRAVCTAGQSQYEPTIASRAPGSAIIAWRDFRNGVDDDIFAGCPEVTGDVSVGWESPATGRVGTPRPNPTRAMAALGFELATSQRVSIEVFDVSGRLVRRIVKGQTFPAGSQTVVWDGTSDHGEAAPAGVYGIRVSGPDFSVTRRVAIVR
jgi:hypothetical protein